MILAEHLVVIIVSSAESFMNSVLIFQIVPCILQFIQYIICLYR